MSNKLDDFYLKAIRKKFEATMVVKGIEKNICDIVKLQTLKKYKEQTLFSNGVEYKLFDVKVNLSSWRDEIYMPKIDLMLVYFCKSKLPKAKRERIEKEKAKYKLDNFLPWSQYKIPLWQQLQYSLDVKDVLGGMINLEIK